MAQNTQGTLFDLTLAINDLFVATSNAQMP